MTVAVFPVAAGGKIGASLRWPVVRWAGHVLGIGFGYRTPIVTVLDLLVAGVAAAVLSILGLWAGLTLVRGVSGP
jgi:fluoride ion exporter CrcB/FEX